MVSPSAGSDLLGRWLSAWAIVYVGGMMHIIGKSRGAIGTEFLSAFLKSKPLIPTFRTDTDSLASQSSAHEKEPIKNPLIGVFPNCNAETGDAYSYSLVDNVNGYFNLIGNELRLAGSALLKAYTDRVYTVTVRRSDESGRVVDKSFAVRIPKSGEPKVEDVSGQLVRRAQAQAS